MIKFLGIDTLQTEMVDNLRVLYKKLDEQKADRNVVDDKFKQLNSRVSHFQESVNVLHNTVENVVHIGTDVCVNHNNREHSWAVICVEGKMNLVKFVSLADSRDAINILDFLKQFEGGKHCIDTPYKGMFYDGMFKF